MPQLLRIFNHFPMDLTLLEGGKRRKALQQCTAFFLSYARSFLALG
jgi:hypothetical protein